MRIRVTKRPLLRVISCVLLLGAAGCGGGPAIKAAERGDLDAVRRTLIERKGSIDASEARGIARAVLSHEVDTAKGDAGAKELRSLSLCAGALDDALSRRAEQTDDVAALATMLRFQAGAIDADALADAARNAKPAPGAESSWRAVAARGLVSVEQGAERRKRIVDPDQEVRLAALRASAALGDPADVEVLLEAARVDPSPEARLLAIDAAGVIGGERVVLALRDLFPQAGEDERLYIVGAWASPRAIEAGGRGQLVRLAETGSGVATIAAAAVLVRRGGDGAGVATDVLKRSIAQGTTRERVFAIRAALLDVPALRDAVLAARTDVDEDVALVALERGLSIFPADAEEQAKRGERKAVIDRLLKMGQGTSVRALLAKGALAGAKVREVLPLLTQDARSNVDQVRKSAGMSLTLMGELGQAAVLAVDPDQRVRTGVACAILSPSRD
jgi:hypothetical protein